MKKRCSFLFILVLTTAFTFYRAGSLVAMAAEQIAEPVAGSEETDEPAADSEPEADDGSAAETGTGSDDGSAAETGTGSDGGPAAETGTGSDDGPAVETEPEANDESAFGSEPEPGQNPDHAIEWETVQIMEAAILPEPEESVSTGPALMEWLESHKNTGGTVKLADHVVLDGAYSYCPDGPNMPAVFVDTDRYTVTVNGVIELLSDEHLTFSGRPDGKGIFYVAEKGMLSMQGIKVESETGALWQEEGAGLVVSDCRTTGSIHYAETPFVVEPDPVCVVVEKGQTVNDVLPEYLCCRVNRQGEVSSDASVPLTWDLAGTERQQEERLRFWAQGSFSKAASAEPVRCTVVYNDYPLTFAEVHASVNGNGYIFTGWYTKPEEEASYTLLSEYSFDAENWLVSNEAVVDGTYADFVIVVDERQSERAAHPYIYIRLQRNDNGTRYFSNVLCYAAEDLDCVEDIGGSRGGGTSIVDPPEEPSEEPCEEPREEPSGSSPKPEEEKPKQKPTSDTREENARSEAKADTDKVEEANDGSDPAGSAASAMPYTADAPNGNTEPTLYAGTAGTDTEPALYAGTADTGAEREIYAEPSKDSGSPALYTYTEYAGSKAGSGENISKDDSDIPGKEEAAAVLSSYREEGANPSHKGECALRTENRQGNYPIIAAGFVLLSVCVGAAGFYAHSRYSRSGTNR